VGAGARLPVGCDVDVSRGCIYAPPLKTPRRARTAPHARTGAAGHHLGRLESAAAIARRPKAWYAWILRRGQMCYQGNPGQALMHVHVTRRLWVVGYLAIKEEAARAYDTEVQRRGWTHGLTCDVHATHTQLNMN